MRNGQDEQDVLAVMIDNVIGSLLSGGVSVMPRVIAEGFTDTLCRGFSAGDRKSYQEQIEILVAARLEILQRKTVKHALSN